MNIVSGFSPLYSLSGFVVGALVGMTGVGGGALMTPVLILLLGFHPTAAVGTDLLYASATKAAGTLFHGLARNIEWRIVGCLSLGSLPAAVITLLILSRVGEIAISGLITTVLGGALFITALALFFRRQILSAYAARMGEMSRRRTTTFTIAIGVVLGVLVSISSVGAGAIGITALILLYPRIPLVRIVGSDIAHAVLLTLFAGIGHLTLISVDFSVLAALLIGSVPGVLAGSYLAPRMPEKVLRMVLASTLVIAGVRLMI